MTYKPDMLNFILSAMESKELKRLHAVFSKQTEDIGPTSDSLPIYAGLVELLRREMVRRVAC